MLYTRGVQHTSIYFFIFKYSYKKKNNGPFIIVQMAEKMMQILIFFQKVEKKEGRKKFNLCCISST